MKLKCALPANPSSEKKKVIALNQRDQSQTNDDIAHHQKNVATEGKVEVGQKPLLTLFEWAKITFYISNM